MSLVRCKRGGIFIAEAGIRTLCFVNYNLKIGYVPVKRMDRPMAVATMKLDYSQASKYCACGTQLEEPQQTRLATINRRFRRLLFTLC